MRAYCSMSQNFLAFNTPHAGIILVFGVPNAKCQMPNAKYLAFGTPDDNAFRAYLG